MNPTASRHLPAMAGSLLAAALLVGPSASAVPITAGVRLTNGSLGTIDLSDSDTSSTAAVVAEAESTVTGAPTGVLLGQAYAGGTPDGLFALGVTGQDTHAHEASFRYIETISNATSISQLLSMSFQIDAGELGTIVREVPPAPGGFLEAGYEIAISFDGSRVFESGALLRQVRTGEFTSAASVTETGTRLGGALTHVESFADEFLFSWGDYAGSLDLGLLGAGASAVLRYDVRVFVAAEGDRWGGTHASIGDPFAVGGTPVGLSFTQPSLSVPEPGPLTLLATGLLGLALARIRREP